MNHRKNSTATGGAVAGRDALMGTSEQQFHYMPYRCACQPKVASDDDH
jgi:hypothetical protein